MMTSNINEGLINGDLRGLVDSILMIDQYKPKIGEDGDTVTVAFTVRYDEPAKDLSNFIQTSDIDHLDVDASESMDENGNYQVFVEFERNRGLYNGIRLLLDMIDKVTSEKGDWKFTALSTDEDLEFNKENFNSYVILSPQEYNDRYKTNQQTAEQEIKERMKFMVNY
jgi:hypothetical protein